MSAGDAEFTKLWRIRKTVHEMLKERNYLVSAEELNRSKDSVRGSCGRCAAAALVLSEDSAVQGGLRSR